MQKIVYQTNAQGLYVGQTVADRSPLEPDVWLIPGGCVEQAPPERPEHKAAHWNGQSWHLVNFYDGLVIYDIKTREPRTLNGLEPIPSGYTLFQPGPDQVWKNGGWVDDTAAILAKVYQEKLTELNMACSQYIEAGFSSSALGELHNYSSSMEDQVNLTGLVFSGLDSAFPCMANGVRQFVAHTRDQLLQVNKDLVVFKQAALQHVDRLKRDAAQALLDKKVKALRAITWSVPA